MPATDAEPIGVGPRAGAQYCEGAAVAGVRDRILDAATAMLAESGWGAVTMGGVGSRAGVSRQTVYNEVGRKAGLAEALVWRELQRFLSAVADELRGGDLVGDVTAAVLRVHLMAAENPVLRAAISTAQGARNDLLPLLTTASAPLLDTATARVTELVRGTYELPAPVVHHLTTAVDAVVRVVLSTVMQPGGSPQVMAARTGWVAGALLAPHRQGRPVGGGPTNRSEPE